jgi:hypothetical protein
MALARLVAAVIDKPTLTNWGAPQTTNLGVSGSNPFGRANFRDIPCDSHGNSTGTLKRTSAASHQLAHTICCVARLAGSRHLMKGPVNIAHGIDRRGD